MTPRAPTLSWGAQANVFMGQPASGRDGDTGPHDECACLGHL